MEAKETALEAIRRWIVKIPAFLRKDEIQKYQIVKVRNVKPSDYCVVC